MDTRIPAVIIDDHDHARAFIRRFVESHFSPEMVIMGEADSVHTALEVIQRTEPRLLFLDIDLQDGSGFEVLELLQTMRERMQVIIVSAFKDQYKSALRYDAAEYLDKPINPKEFREGVERVLQKVHTMIRNEQLHLDHERLRSERDRFAEQLRLHTNITQTPEVYTVRHQNPTNPITEIPLREIVYCHADKDYTFIHRTNSKKPVQVSKNLGTVEEELAKYPFFCRITRSYLINLAHCAVMDTPQKDEMCVTVPQLGDVSVERAFKERFRAAIQPFMK